MVRKRTAVLTINSVTAISKVRSSHSNQNSLYNNILDKISSLNLVKNNSTAAERTDFQTETDHSYSSNREFQQNPGGFHRENPGAFRQNQADVYRGNPSEYQQNLVAQNRNPNGFYREDARELQRNPNSFYNNSSKDFPNKPNGYYKENCSVQGPHRSYSEPRKIPEKPNGFQQDSNSELQRSQNGYYKQNIGEFQQNPNGHSTHFSVNGGQFQQNPSGYYGESVGGFQPNQDGFQRGTSDVHSQLVNNVKSEGRIIKTAEHSHYMGTIDEMNTLCKEGKVKEAVKVLSLLEEKQISVDLPGYFQLMQVCGEVVAKEEAKAIHNHLMRSKQYGEVNVQNKILEMYLKCGSLTDAYELFDNMRTRDLTSWDIMIIGLTNNGLGEDAIHNHLMKKCREVVAKEDAKAIHSHLMRSKQYVEVSVQNKILEMYLKCGSITDAYDLFEKMPTRNMTSWDIMIIGLTNNGLGEDAIDLFTQFKEAGLRPDDQIFFGIFSACTALCDVAEGMLHFESMSKVYGIAPSMDHYLGVVKMLGSTGNLDEAVEFIEMMPLEPSVDVWETLMDLCRIHGNLELGDHCAKLVDHLDPSHLNDQSKAGLLPEKASDLAKVEEKKKLLNNVVDYTTRVQEYRAGDTSHPETTKIYAHLRGLSAQMKEAGYVPETRFCLHDIDQESREEALLAHSEKLAVTHGLITSSARLPMRIIKNLRVCGDCHTALKIISKLVGRDLIVRDAKRFHHFKDGSCSCKDFW